MTNIKDVKNLLEKSQTIAIVGLSTNPERDSYIVADYLRNHGYKIIPINPNIENWNGLKSYQRVIDVTDTVDIIDIFRKNEAVLDIVKEALRLRQKPKAIWIQLGIENNEARELAEKNDLFVVGNKCIKIEHQRLFSNHL